MDSGHHRAADCTVTCPSHGPDSLEAALGAVPQTHICVMPGDRLSQNCCQDVVDSAALADVMQALGLG